MPCEEETSQNGEQEENRSRDGQSPKVILITRMMTRILVLRNGNDGVFLLYFNVFLLNLSNLISLIFGLQLISKDYTVAQPDEEANDDDYEEDDGGGEEGEGGEGEEEDGGGDGETSKEDEVDDSRKVGRTAATAIKFSNF